MKKRVTIDSHLDKKIKNQVTYLDLLQSVLQFGIQLTEGRKKKKRHGCQEKRLHKKTMQI